MRRVLLMAGALACAPPTWLSAQQLSGVLAPSRGQQPGDSRVPTATVTVGVGVSYAIGGLLGEFYLARPRFSLLVGAGVIPGVGAGGAGVDLGASLGLRAYTGGTNRRFYFEGMGACWLVDYPAYGPALLVGYSSIASSGTTFNAAIGIGVARAGDAHLGLAFNLGYGYTW